MTTALGDDSVQLLRRSVCRWGDGGVGDGDGGGGLGLEPTCMDRNLPLFLLSP